jgi:hypothetical protein
VNERLKDVAPYSKKYTHVLSRARGAKQCISFSFINNRVKGLLVIITLCYLTYMTIYLLQLREF